MKKFLLLIGILILGIMVWYFYMLFRWEKNNITINNNFANTVQSQSFSEWINENINPFDSYDIYTDSNGNIHFTQKIFQPYHTDNEHIIMQEKFNEETWLLKQWVFNNNTKNFSMNFSYLLPNNQK